MISLRKITQPCQIFSLTNILIKFCTFKMFRTVKIKKWQTSVELVDETFIGIIKSLNLVKTTYKHSHKIEHF